MEKLWLVTSAHGSIKGKDDDNDDDDDDDEYNVGDDQDKWA